MKTWKTLALALAATSALVAPALAQEAAVRNVIVLISDGASVGTWPAASYYRFGALGHEAYDDFDVQIFAATHPLNTSNEPTFTDEGSVTFDPSELWVDTPVDTVFEGGLGNYEGFFAGYDYARADYTDSAAAATALASGNLTYNNAINWSNNGEPMKHIGEYVVESGRSLGVVSSVQIVHATPAAFLGHNVSRNDYVALGQEVIDSGLATVVFGSGHPHYNAAGQFVENPSDGNFRYVGGREYWDRIVAGETAYTLIEERADFEALASGEFDYNGEQLLGLFQNNATLQYNRPGFTAGNLLDNVPNLATLTTAALNVLDTNEEGFFLMVEGGAVDWAAHANNLPRLLEEQVDFNMAVEAAVAWVEENSSWEETMIVVTTDHGNGLLQGPLSDTQAYQPIVNQGQGAFPLVRWHSDTHTRELIPLFAHGAGAEYFTEIGEPEAGLAIYDVAAERQLWVHIADVFRASMAAFGIEEDAAE